MNAAFRSFAWLLVGACVAVAESPKTRVVVLDNENLVEGEVSKVADGYEIRRSAGDMTLPTTRVVAVVADRKEAFAVVAERANRRDADERLRLARWCAANGLPDEALAEARTAARMRPGFAAAERYAQSLEAMAKQSPKIDPAVVPARAETPARDTVTDVPAVDYNSESFPMFAGKVNAVLLNTCASCHARDDVKAFHLTRVGGRGGATRNLMAALPHVNAIDPAASLMLLKAVTPHGGATDAPIKTRAHPAYQTLETWVRFARAPEGTAAPAPPEPAKLPDLPPEKPAAPPVPTDAFGQDSKTVPPRPTKTEAADPFDPAIFNGEVKPRK